MPRPARLQQRPTIAQLLEEQRDAFDQAMAEISDGIRSSVHYDELEAKFTAIARGVRDAFRKGRVG
jgi:hypothetical protein